MVYRRDIGGQAKLRRLWRHYYLNTDALIFVLDSSDHERMEEARDEMFHVLMDPNMDKCQTVLIFLNKQVEAVNERVPIAIVQSYSKHTRQRAAVYAQNKLSSILG